MEMNLAICSTGELYGGVEQFIYTFSERLQRENNIKFVVILFHKGKLYWKLREINTPVEYIETRFKYDLFAICKIAKILKKYQITIVHTHGYKATILAGIAGKLCKTKLIKTEHGKIENEEGMSFYKMIFNETVDKIVSKNLFNHVVFVSKELENNYFKIYRKINRSVVYNGIKPINTKSCNFLDDHHFKVGIVGRICHVKGHIYLLKAIKHLYCRNSIRLYIFGDGPLERSIKEYCKNNDLLQQVRFMGFKENIHDYLTELDLLIIPSLHEGLPYTLLEAMYLKIPVIASEVGGMKEILENETDSILVPPANAERLADSIIYMYENIDIRKHLADNAYAKINKDYLVDHMISKYQDIYKSL